MGSHTSVVDGKDRGKGRIVCSHGLERGKRRKKISKFGRGVGNPQIEELRVPRVIFRKGLRTDGYPREACELRVKKNFEIPRLQGLVAVWIFNLFAPHFVWKWEQTAVL
jgi:hypothetical protein